MTTIAVTAEHIAKGIRADCERCPIALAFLDAFPDLTYISVGDDIMMQFSAFAGVIYVDAPDEVLAFIEAYDDGEGGEPFSFDLDYPAVTA